ncbi:hypothetical protein FRC17_004001 [Serendipita sp. 399]|nr:hypothetical protein FRC17_004001 [Serendipita sp. 399]
MVTPSSTFNPNNHSRDIQLDSIRVTSPKSSTPFRGNAPDEYDWVPSSARSPISPDRASVEDGSRTTHRRPSLVRKGSTSTGDDHLPRRSSVIRWDASHVRVTQTQIVHDDGGVDLTFDLPSPHEVDTAHKDGFERTQGLDWWDTREKANETESSPQVGRGGGGGYESRAGLWVSPADMDKVRTTLKQFVRDWSEEGRAERDQCYKPMIEALLNHFPDEATRSQRRVSIPGAGLARLGWEVAFLGFETQCNEFSHYMLLPSYYVLNETKRVNQHTIYPFIHSLSNSASSTSPLRGVSFPDVLPSSLPPGSNFSMVAGDFEELFGIKELPEEDEAGKWDAVMTCFFIDTASSIFSYGTTHTY